MLQPRVHLQQGYRQYQTGEKLQSCVDVQRELNSPRSLLVFDRGQVLHLWRINPVHQHRLGAALQERPWVSWDMR